VSDRVKEGVFVMRNNEYNKRVTIRIGEELLRKLSQLAEQRGIPLSHCIRLALAAYA